MTRPAGLVVIVALGATGGHPTGQARVSQRACLKASNADAADHFGGGGVGQGHTGQGVALSADGTTMVVGGLVYVTDWNAGPHVLEREG